MSLFGLATLDDLKYEFAKRDWRENGCLKGQHFVGAVLGLCAICGEQAKLLKGGGYRFKTVKLKECPRCGRKK